MDNKVYIKELFILNNKLKRLLDTKHQKNGLHSGQARVLIYLYRNKDQEIYQKDIESTFQIRGGSVTGIIDSLVKYDYIKRVSLESDKRKRKIVLTLKGETFAEHGIETTTHMESRINDLMDEKERVVFESVLLKMNNWIDEEEQNEKTN